MSDGAGTRLTTSSDLGSESSDGAGTRLTTNSDLEDEALSLRHLLTHLPRNPHCKVCSAIKVNKTIHIPKRKRDKNVPNMFGEQVTTDPLISNPDCAWSAFGALDAAVLYDAGTRYVQLLPTGARSAQRARHELKWGFGAR